MSWTKYTTRYTRAIWQADLLAGLGRACHIVALGGVLGMIIGTWPLAAGAMLAVGGMAAAGVACMAAAGSLKRCAEALPEAEESRRIDESHSAVGDGEPERSLEREPRFVDMLEQQRGRSISIVRLI